MPSKPGVYIFKGEKNKILYVGKAKDLRKRVGSYFSNRILDAKTLKLVSVAKDIKHIVVGSEVEAFLLEASLIKKYKPYFNIQFSDDKFFPYLAIWKKPVPYVSITRNVQDKTARYFGPYTSSSDLKTVLKILRRIFPYQSVKNHSKKKCLYYHLKLCLCVPVFPENISESKKNIRDLINFLEGKKDGVVRSLKKEQKKYILKEEFEKASEIQSKIEKIELITSARYDPFTYQAEPNFYYQRIQNELASLKAILLKYGVNLNTLKRIECYDISNISGQHATGSMVVFTDGDSNKNEYRRFRIRSKTTPDDFAMIREVLLRRLRRTGWEMPNLMVIDGGRGQVSAALQAFAQSNIKLPVIGLAKKEETIIIPIRMGSKIDFLEPKLPKSTPGINLLRRIRDEAHRFAINYHRFLRKKSLNI